MLFGMLVLFPMEVFAGITMTVNGKSSGASLAQCDTLQWTITGLSTGVTVAHQRGGQFVRLF
jgi:hypothetical protein